MGIVFINGQRYDSVSGLKLDESTPPAEPSETSELQVIEVKQKSKRIPKQQRLAEAIAREFEEMVTEELTAPEPAVTTEPELEALIEEPEPTAEPITREVPDWLGEFTERQVSPSTPPNWINNYVAGGDPIEIQPIGLEAAARESAQKSTEPVRRVEPQNRRALQRSKTLNRSFVKKPMESTSVFVKKSAVAPVATHPKVRRFAPAPENFEEDPTAIIATPSEVKTESETSFAPVMTHSMEEKLAQHELAKTTSSSSSSDLKNALINEQMDRPIDHKARARAEKRAAKKAAARTRRRFTAPTLITASLAVLVLGGYFAYVSMPSISVRVAANRAGIDAHAPYTPSGYSIDGPVAYEPGRVTINYKSNGGGEGYSITQQKNSWGDSVVLDNLVENGNYTTIETGGVTVYRFGNQTAWIQNGILFTMSGNNSIGDNQITRIVDSL
ncbi:DUF4367 domain-containing protein [Candidatus Saccharibacteria bacterium]|nr:DUF4367 domain-containing protein [Candidatus Saccharibacteria bacterium]